MPGDGWINNQQKMLVDQRMPKSIDFSINLYVQFCVLNIPQYFSRVSSMAKIIFNEIF